MSSLGFRGRVVAIAAGAMLLTLVPTRGAQTQDENEPSVSITPADKAAAAQARNNFHRGQPRNTQRGKSTRGELALAQRPSSPASKSADSSARGAVRYPADLTYQGGTVVDFAQSHAIYLLPNGKCPIPHCWGNPEGFLRDLSNSDFIHLVDQYIGLGASRRYTVGTRAKVTYVNSLSR
jgi:hypothetical protein